MKVFDHPNLDGGMWKCPICGENTDSPVILASVIGTEDGFNVEAEQIHVDCIELSYSRDMKALVMKI